MANTSFELKMSDGNLNTLNEWLPESFDSVLVVSHGMQEHSLRYTQFAEFLNANGIALVAEDHRGHGETALKAGGQPALSFLAETDGFNRVTEDIYEEILYARRRFQGKKVFLFGHSFGSFIAQNLIEKHGEAVDKVVLCGTAGPRRTLIPFAKAAGFLAKKFCGAKTKSKFMNSLTFGNYNSKIRHAKTELDWLSRCETEVEKYMKDPLCGVTASNGFLYDIFSGLAQIHERGNMKRIPKDLPIFLIAGTADPVGSYGKTVRKLHREYQTCGIKTASIKLYEGARHELLNETNREEVMRDVLEFLRQG